MPIRRLLSRVPSGSASYHSALAIKDNVGINFPFVEQGNSNLNGITYNTGFFKADDYYFRPVELGTIRNSNNKFVNTSPGYRTLPPNLDGQPLNNRNWTYAGAVWDANGYWGPKGNYWVYDYPFFTSGGNCTPVVPVGKNGQSCEGPYYGVTGFTTDFNPNGLKFYNSILAIRQDNAGAEIGRWVVGDGNLSGKFPNMRHFAARKDGRFTLSFPDDPLPKQIALNVENAYRDTDTFILGLKFDGSVTPMGYTFGGNQSYRLYPKDHWTAAEIASNAPYTQSMRYFKYANSMAELVATTTDVMWQDKTNNMLWIRYKGGIAREQPIPHLKDSGDFELLRSYSVVVYPKP